MVMKLKEDVTEICLSVRRNVLKFGRNEKNYCDHNFEKDAVEEIGCVSRDYVVQMLKEIKTGNAHGPSDVSLK